MCNPPRSSFGRSNLVRRQSIETDSTTRDIHPGPERGLYAASPGSSGRPSRLIHAWPAFVRVGGCGSGACCPLLLVAEYRSEEHTSELQSRFGISYAVFCLKKKKTNTTMLSHPRLQHIIYSRPPSACS